LCVQTVQFSKPLLRQAANRYASCLATSELQTNCKKLIFKNPEYRQMKKHYLHKQICSLLLLLIFVIFCKGQNGNGQMFHGAIQDKAGNLWFATISAGVYRYNSVSGGFTNFTEKNGLCANNVSSILEDKAGNIWFSTEYGVCRYDGKSFTNITTKDSLCHYNINCILEDKSGNLWFGTNGYGVCRYNPVSGVVTNFTKEQGLGSNAIQCILEDKTGNLWFGERAGGVCRYDSASGLFTKVNAECLSDQIMDIIEDKTGNIWFANLYNGLCRYDPASGGFTHFTEENGLCHNFVTCIYQDKKGNLWFGSDTGKEGTEGGGLCRYDGKSFTRFTTKDGLSHMNVWTIMEDNDGNIWVCSKGGLYRFHSPSGKFIDFTHKVNR
jgi:ligand-binding sensor domain-containing protein